MRISIRRSRAVSLVAAVTAGSALVLSSGGATTASASTHAAKTPIQHLVVIFQENVSFDRYFGTYPNATNTSGEPFYAIHKKATVNGLSNALLTANPNGVNPRRLDPSN